MWAADLELGAVDALKKGSGKAVRLSLAILTLVWLHLLGLYILLEFGYAFYGYLTLASLLRLYSPPPTGADLPGPPCGDW